MSQDIVAVTRESINDAVQFGSQENVLLALGYAKRLRELAKELTDQAEQAAIGYIKEHGEFAVGETRYYVGVRKDTKCKDAKAVLAAVLEVTGGDLDAVNECLSSGAWKPGATKKVLGDAAVQHFETVEVGELREGKAVPRLQVVNTAFTK